MMTERRIKKRMILFQCDYNEGAHPKVMEKLMETNLEQTVGYGEDEHCVCASGSLITFVLNCFTYIRVSCLHLGQ